MPTRNRRWFVAHAIRYFLRQAYPQRELIIVDDGEDAIGDLIPTNARIRYHRLPIRLTLGDKRNLACELASGTLIVHWDDDDWMAADRLQYQVGQLLRRGKLLCGTGRLLGYDMVKRRGWQYVPPSRARRPWLAGTSLCYTKAAWAERRFLSINLGEDEQFLTRFRVDQVAALPRHDFVVAMSHVGNTAVKGRGPFWYPLPAERLRDCLKDDWTVYQSTGRRDQVPVARARDNPLVSCIMPTHNRPDYVRQAIAYFLRQNYPHKELIIVDDGEAPAVDEVPQRPDIRVMRLHRPLSIGVKRNLACSRARGEVILHWDDDDWYGSQRISHQLAPLLAGTADITAFADFLFWSLPTSQFWACTPELFQKMFVQGVAGGSLAFWKRYWQAGVRYPNTSLAEDADLLKGLTANGARLQRLPNQGDYIYIRHTENTWRFRAGTFLEQGAWSEVEAPAFIPPEDVEFYTLAKG